MKTKKHISILFTCVLLNGCTNNSPSVVVIGTTAPIVKVTEKPVVTVNPNISTLPTKIPTLDTIINANPVISNGEGPNSTGTHPVLPSITVTANSSTQPSGNTGSSSDIKDLATFNGRIYDTNGYPVEGATVSAKSIDANVSWVGEAQQTVGGAYVFRNAPVGARIQITATKDGWSIRDRSEVLKSNLQGDPSGNVFNFGSPSGGGGLTGDNIYSIQDEPEISLLKINGRQVLSAFSGDYFNGTTGQSAPASLGNTTNGLTSSSFAPSLTGVDGSNLEIEVSFTESVIHSEVEDFFKVSSQDFENADSLIINSSSSGSSFSWPTDRTFVFKYNKPLVTNKEGIEARYIINFTSPFHDKTGKAAIKNRYFRFSTSQINDFAVFSVRNIK